MKQLLFSLFILGNSVAINAQETLPHIKGTVKISVEQGTFECDFTLSNLPKIDDYLIRLNAGMNLLHFRSLQPHDFVVGYDVSKHDSLSSGESIAYYFPDNTGKGKFLPQELQIRYVGKYPIANDTLENYSRFDWRGNIAFNGSTLRADGLQSAWYPYLYDAEKEIEYQEMTYDVAIECLDCSSIYVNGKPPVKGQSAHLISDTPYELALFCGKYGFYNDGKVIVLNPTFSEENIADFAGMISEFEHYYEEKIGITYSEPPVFVNTTPTSKYHAWLFVAYPTIYGIGWGDNGLGGLFNDREERERFKQYIAHELGHYYFGTYKVFNATLGDMMSEGFAEYLSLKLVEDLQSKELYDEKVSEKIEYLDKFKTRPISKMNSISDIQNREIFVYVYAPMLFIAIEKEVGEEKMWKWINTILETKTDFTNYDFLEKTLREALQDEKQTQFIIDRYFSTQKSTQNVVKRVKKEE